VLARAGYRARLVAEEEPVSEGHAIATLSR
jgi:hypothetical protein